MMHPYKKSPPDWTNNEFLNELKVFTSIYKTRPLKENKGGMMFPHMFATFFMLRKKTIFEKVAGGRPRGYLRGGGGGGEGGRGRGGAI